MMLVLQAYFGRLEPSLPTFEVEGIKIKVDVHSKEESEEELD
jgi:hypothetical protein